jgi:hypothetical protein
MPYVGAQEFDTVQRDYHHCVDDRAGQVHLLRIEHELLGHGSDDCVLAGMPRSTFLASFHHREVLAMLACAPAADACTGMADGSASNAPHSDAVESTRRNVIESPRERSS